MGSKKTIVWFRRDLRIEDNPALAAAAKDGCVLPVYIWCPKEEGQFYPGRVSRWWLKQSLVHLRKSLESLGVDLIFIKTQSTLSALIACIKSVGATKLVFNHLYDPVSLVRDHQIKQKLVDLGISVQSYNADLLFEPWEVYDERGLAFTTFDAYWDKCLSMQLEAISHAPAWRLSPAAGEIERCSIDNLDLEAESEKLSNALLGRAWSPGWGPANKALMEFIEHHLIDYANNRSRLGSNSTSLLSPYLHFGEISVRKVYQCTRVKQILWAKEGNSSGEESATLFLKAIGLREYSRYLCFNFPFTHERSLLNNLKYFPWCADQAHFKAWRQGRTGYPLVDAGMRELWATGWIHNRIRVIVSSFAVKFLLLPWKWGMKYFWDTLLDADLESDILGWQYISGSLPDGHELERMDSPEIQGFKYDPEGEYVRQWIPELARMPTEWIHHPWDAPASVLKASGVDLGLNYPRPIIDVDVARENLSDAIFKMWETEGAVRGSRSNGIEEVIGDSSDSNEESQIPKVVLREKALCPSDSSNDQRVPTVYNAKNEPSCRKRRNDGSSGGQLPDKLEKDYIERGGTATGDDACSMAEPSPAKKQTTSRASCSVPHSWSSSNANSMETEASEMKQPWQKQLDGEHFPSENNQSQFCK